MSKKHHPGFLKLVNAAKARIVEVTVADVLARQADGDDTFVLVDTREQSEWAAGHIAGAVYMGKGVIERDAEKTWPDLHTELILYSWGRLPFGAGCRSTPSHGLYPSGVDGWWLAGLDCGRCDDKPQRIAVFTVDLTSNAPSLRPKSTQSRRRRKVSNKGPFRTVISHPMRTMTL